DELLRDHNLFFFFSSRRRHTRSKRDWSSDVCSSDLISTPTMAIAAKPSEEMIRTRSERGAVFGDDGGASPSGVAAMALVVVVVEIGRASCRERGGGAGGGGSGE